MFDFVKQRKYNEWENVAGDILKAQKVETLKDSKDKETYSVGITDEGLTVLRLMHNGYNMSLTMNQDACERLIKILRSTYSDEGDK
jgi:hypothetical protein